MTAKQLQHLIHLVSSILDLVFLQARNKGEAIVNITNLTYSCHYESAYTYCFLNL